MNKVTLLWSGGWDGTFRLLQLSQVKDLTIQPVYVIDQKRKSREFELKAMKSVIEDCRQRFEANILEPIYYDKDWILQNCADEKISDAFRQLHKKYRVGWQYRWFALLCKHLKVQMESAVVHQYHGKVENAIEGEGRLELIENDILPDRYHVLPKEDNDLAYTLFGDLILPIIKITKKDEERIARENGWIDIIKKSWFCHTPINGEPCGICGPCDDAMNTGMEWRMPEKAKRRHRYRKVFLAVRNIKKVLGK